MAGIVTSGVYNVVIENNTLDGNYAGGIVYLESLGLQSNSTSGKYDVHIRNNIVTNSVKRGGNKSGSPGGVLRRAGRASSITIRRKGSLFWKTTRCTGMSAAITRTSAPHLM